MRKINQAGEDLIKRWESFVDHIYICAGGIETIGWGETNPEIIEQYRNEKMDIETGNILFSRSIVKYERAVRKLINVPLTDNEFSALVSFTYNLGANALKISTLRKVILRGDYHKAPEQINKWVYSKGRKLRGLVLRRADESRLWAL